MSDSKGKTPFSDSAPVEQLLAENAELKRQIQRLGIQQTHLSHRLQRVEDSQVFRALRWLGNRFQDLPAWVQRLLPVRKLVGAAASPSYEDWIQQSAAIDIARDSAEQHSESTELVSVLVWKSNHLDAESEEQLTLASVAGQSHVSRETYFSSDSVEELRGVLAKCTGTYVALVPSGCVLEPRTIQQWVQAAERGVEIIYSDWDYLDSQNRRHTPRFTPEFSPTLLEQTLYWGGCFLVRAQLLRQVLESDLPHRVSLLHGICIEASRKGRVVRIPRVLWHQTGPTDENVLATPKPEAHFSASIVICSRSPERLRRCLTILKPTIDGRTEVIVVNHETNPPNNLKEIAKGFGAKVVTYNGPFHFGYMNQLGVREAKGSVIVFMNDDVFPITPDWLERMAQHLSKPDVGLVGALLLYPSNQIQHAGVVVGGMRGATHIGQHMTEAHFWPWLTLSREVTAVTGACMAIRRDAWEELGGFDLRYPVNYNDIDLCLRARRAGYRVVFEATARLTHEESQTRVPGARPEEIAMFSDQWGDVLERPDPYFHPDLTCLGRDIPLRSPWYRLS